MEPVRILEELESGWTYPYRAKKAHYFDNNKGESICRKYKKTGWRSSLLPTTVFLYKSELCFGCLRELTRRAKP